MLKTDQRLHFYVTAAYPCSYIEQQYARSLVASPSDLIDSFSYNILIKSGFRRSGYYVYSPHCDECSACTPVRLPVHQFSPNRTQRKLIQKHHDLVIKVVEPEFSIEHYELYLRYQRARHPGGGMDEDNPEQFKDFLLRSRVNTRIYEFRTPTQKLVMVSIIDIIDDGFSSVYTFYDPDIPGSWGTWNILWQIQQSKQEGLNFVYLGYWIKNCSKMSYKQNFQPLQGLLNEEWRELNF